jgi:hypothetical protein
MPERKRLPLSKLDSPHYVSANDAAASHVVCRSRYVSGNVHRIVCAAVFFPPFYLFWKALERLLRSQLADVTLTHAPNKTASSFTEALNISTVLQLEAA